MRQTGKLYKYYFKKIWQRNWLRILFVAIAIAMVGFVVPYIFFRRSRKMAADDLKVIRTISQSPYKDRPIAKRLLKSAGEVSRKFKATENFSFRSFSRFWLGKDTAEFGNTERELLENLPYGIKESAEGLEKITNPTIKENKEEELENLKNLLSRLEWTDKSIVPLLSLPYNADHSIFFNQNDRQPFWQLLNNISGVNLTGFFFLFWLIFSIMDSFFFDTQSEGEEITILTLTPRVKRSDLFFSKILAFLTFFLLANVLFFLLPFSFYYFGAGPTISGSGYLCLVLGTTVIGPLLFFCLFLAPYLFFKAVADGASGIISSLLTFAPGIGMLSKMFLFGYSTKPYTVEKGFFDPFNFTIMALISGVIFLATYHGYYQEQDLSN